VNAINRTGERGGQTMSTETKEVVVAFGFGTAIALLSLLLLLRGAG